MCPTWKIKSWTCTLVWCRVCCNLDVQKSNPTHSCSPKLIVMSFNKGWWGKMWSIMCTAPMIHTLRTSKYMPGAGIIQTKKHKSLPHRPHFPLPFNINGLEWWAIHWHIPNSQAIMCTHKTPSYVWWKTLAFIKKVVEDFFIPRHNISASKNAI